MSLKHSLREGAVSVEHKSGDLLIPLYVEILTEDRKAHRFVCAVFLIMCPENDVLPVSL